MNSNDFYRIVRRLAGPSMQAAGFRRSASGEPLGAFVKAGLWIKLVPGAPFPAPKRRIVSFEHEKWGWFEHSGGSFRVWLEFGPVYGIEEVLDEEQRRQMAAMDALVAQRSPHGVRFPDGTIEEEDDALRKVSGRLHPYYDEADITGWLTLILPWLPGLCDSSPPG